MLQGKTFMSSDRNAKLVGLFIGAMLLFTFPILHIFGKEKLIFGLPVLYFYIFVTWIAVIFFIRQIFKNQNRD